MTSPTEIPDPVYARYLAGLLDGDRGLCLKVVQERCARGVALKDLYLNLFQRSLYEVGDLWEQHRISVATEHLATAITERAMSIVHPQLFSGAARDRTIVVACVADEFHQLGARMVADLAELHGWRGYFLGANTPLEGLIAMVDARRPVMLALSLSIYGNLPTLVNALDAVVTTFPGLPVMVGGQAFRDRWGGTGALQKYSGVTHAPTLDDVERLLSP